MTQTSEVQQAPPPKPPAWSAFWPALWLALILIACKAVHVRGIETLDFRSLSRWFQDLLIVSGADVVYAIGFGVVGGALLSLAARWQRLQAIVWAELLIFGAISVAYAIASARAFAYLRMPLTYSMIYLAQSMSNMKSSVGAFIDREILIVLALAIIGYLALSFGFEAWRRSRNRKSQIKNRRFHIARSFAVAIALAIALWFHHAASGPWSSRHAERRLADNPHYALAASYIEEWLGGKSIHVQEDFPPEYLDDFKQVRERPALTASPTPNLKRGPKNVIVVICESVGTQHLSLYGSSFKTWPHLEKEAANALIFDNYYAHITNTANSLVSLTLSLYTYPLSYREITVENPHIPGQSPADVLKPLGYRTAFISAGRNEFSNQQAFLQGRSFDVIWGAPDLCKEPLNSWGAEDKYMVDGILKFIDQSPKKPFCIYSWTQGTHHPYGAEYGMDAPGWEIEDFHVDKARWKGMWWDLGRYLNALKETDRQIGRLLDALRQRGLADDTLVVVTGDHGEAFGWPHPSYGHSNEVWEEDLHVPLILWNPAIFKNAGHSKVVGAHVDLSPTVLDILGVNLPPTWQGRSLLGNQGTGRAYLYGALDNYYLGVRQGQWKYALNVTEGREELFDLAADPLEQTNVAPQHEPIARELRGRVKAWARYERQLNPLQPQSH